MAKGRTKNKIPALASVSTRDVFEKRDFFKDVYEVVALIPFGKVTSYGAIAKYLGSAGASRMVGWAMNNSHTQVPPIPAHRVVNRNGLLSGKAHFGTPNRMQTLLEEEGHIILQDKIQKFEQVFWDPSRELNME
jgi:methylated-DNA-protein-cysteine methyltransferase-like protein